MDSLDLDVLIIGAGISGINAAYRLQEGVPDYSYAILEARHELGGTWSLFKYPGIRSDSDLYTFGFPWDPWNNDSPIATAPSIMKYLRTVTKRHGIDQHIRYQQKVLNLNWQPDGKKWRVKVLVNETEERIYHARFIGVGTGYYDYKEYLPSIIPGIENFQGQVVRPQFWPENFDYADKKVVIIGSGATAVTILPALHEKAQHVTMLQRSPGYFIKIPQKIPLDNALRRWLPFTWALAIIRAKYLIVSTLFFYFCTFFPNKSRQLLRSGVAADLPPGVDIDPHFAPSYNPWEQRLCMTPDGDFFQALRSKRADIVTDQISDVTANGITLKSGQKLDADIIIVATGLKMQLMGSATVTIDDGAPIEIGDKFMWRGAMLQDVPNLAYFMGYTNASWTLGADATALLFVRLLQDLKRRGVDSVTPHIAEGTRIDEVPIMNLSSGYIKTAIEKKVLPKAGNAAPWAPRRSYWIDSWFAKYGDIKSGLSFSSS